MPFRSSVATRVPGELLQPIQALQIFYGQYKPIQVFYSLQKPIQAFFSQLKPLRLSMSNRSPFRSSIAHISHSELLQQIKSLLGLLWQIGTIQPSNISPLCLQQHTEIFQDTYNKKRSSSDLLQQIEATINAFQDFNNKQKLAESYIRNRKGFYSKL